MFEKSFLHKDALCDCSQPIVLCKRYKKKQYGNKAVQFTIHFFVSFSIISQKQEKRVRDNKKYGKLSANKVLRDFISWNKEAIDNTFS